ncbi:hypothetical protein EON65_21220 [archaeon]|nr:MAG: hypothetical protein EON65_21220 [archaeon]
MAGIFFFLAFSIVCRQWSGLLQLGSYFRVVYGYNSLIVSNITFAVVDIVGIVFCATSPSLNHFFDSTGFVVITFIEGLRNCVYSIFLCYYGIKLVRRFWHFSRMERSSGRQTGWLTGLMSEYCSWLPLPTSSEQVFTKVVFRLVFVLSLTTLCFAVRVGMLLFKMSALHDHTTPTSPTFTLFGFWWFVCSDFIPRAVPTLCFIFLMRTKKPKAEASQHSDSELLRSISMSEAPSNSLSGASHSGNIPFVKLSQDIPFDAPTASFEGFSFHGSRLPHLPGAGDDVEVTLNTMHEVSHLTVLGDSHSVYSDEEGDDDLQDPGEAAIDKIFNMLKYRSPLDQGPG